jgi:lysophospholipase L1-like esterase
VGWRCGVFAPAVLIAVGCFATACAGSGSPSTSMPKPRPARPWSIVALGDSVPAGTACDCRPYPSLSAAELKPRLGRTVTARNDAVPGFTTSGVLHQLESESSVMEEVRAADVVEIEIGANDVGYTRTCGTSVDCYGPQLPTMEENLAAIVARVHHLTSGHKTLVVLLDYWSVWLGGQYAAAKGETYVAAAEEVTDKVNAAIRSTAAASGSAYVDLRAAFKGQDYAYDETKYLAADGDHPNAAGHQQIAEAAVAVIEKALHI